MKNNQIKVIEQQVLRFRQDVGLGNTDAINLRSLLLKLNILTLFRPLSDDFSGMCLKDSVARTVRCLLYAKMDRAKGILSVALNH